jgi:hypothetical protein
MKMYLKMMTGKTLTIRIWALATVELLKQKIQDLEGIPPDQQRLLFEGRQLEDGRRLLEYRVLPESLLYVVLRLRGGMFHATSARKDFDTLPDSDVPRINLNLILPNGDHESVSCSQMETVDDLKKQALTLVEARTHTRKRLKTRETEAQDGKVPAEASVNQTIDNLRASLLDAELEKKRLGEAILAVELEKERLLRSEGSTASTAVSDAEEKIASLRSSLFDTELERKRTGKALLDAEMELERKKRESSCGGN